jgi:hypothetical protein
VVTGGVAVSNGLLQSMVSYKALCFLLRVSFALLLLSPLLCYVSSFFVPLHIYRLEMQKVGRKSMVRVMWCVLGSMSIFGQIICSKLSPKYGLILV